MEQYLANIVKKMANLFYGCTSNQVKTAAFEYAKALKLKHNFNTASRMAGRVWFEGFVSKNNISVRKPEAISINTVTAFNRSEVQQFYNLLEELMEKYKFLLKNIFNCDETGISTISRSCKSIGYQRTEKGWFDNNLEKRKKHHCTVYHEYCRRIYSSNVYIS